MRTKRGETPALQRGMDDAQPPLGKLRGSAASPSERGAPDGDRRADVASKHPVLTLGHLLGEILLTGFLGPSWGTHCPPGVTWSLVSALAVMLEGFPAERALGQRGHHGHSKWIKSVVWMFYCSFYRDFFLKKTQGPSGNAWIATQNKIHMSWGHTTSPGPHTPSATALTRTDGHVAAPDSLRLVPVAAPTALAALADHLPLLHAVPAAGRALPRGRETMWVTALGTPRWLGRVPRAPGSSPATRLLSSTVPGRAGGRRAGVSPAARRCSTWRAGCGWCRPAGAARTARPVPAAPACRRTCCRRPTPRPPSCKGQGQC